MSSVLTVDLDWYAEAVGPQVWTILVSAWTIRGPRLGALVGSSLVATAITVLSTRQKRDSAERDNYAVRLLHSQHAMGVSVFSQPNRQCRQSAGDGGVGT